MAPVESSTSRIATPVPGAGLWSENVAGFRLSWPRILLVSNTALHGLSYR